MLVCCRTFPTSRTAQDIQGQGPDCDWDKAPALVEVIAAEGGSSLLEMRWIDFPQEVLDVSYRVKGEPDVKARI